MSIEVREEPATTLAEYARIPIAFEVGRVLDLTVQGVGLGGFILSERSLEAPYVKDYDADAGEGPGHWASRFDISNWGLFAARAGGGGGGGDQFVGMAAVAFDTEGLDMLEGRRDLAVLWDIRVSPEARGRAVGSALFKAAEAWAIARGCRWLKVETQNINVPACRFYARQGCVLGAIHRFAYPEFPDEIQLLWYKELLHGAPRVLKS